ncbi:MAG TPA: hypothetical protein VKP64_16310 [Mycobacteriales bacterium]|nr:hypothetical protein [Mycobacteriales bacterium]
MTVGGVRDDVAGPGGSYLRIADALRDPRCTVLRRQPPAQLPEQRNPHDLATIHVPSPLGRPPWAVSLVMTETTL